MYDSLQPHGKIAVDEIGMELQDVFDTEGKLLLSPVTITSHDQIESLGHVGVRFACINSTRSRGIRERTDAAP